MGGSSFVLGQSSKFQAVIFDLDGTLVNTGPLITESFRYTIGQVFHEDLPLNELTALVGIPLAQQMSFFANKYYDQRKISFCSVETVEHLTDILLTTYRGYCSEVRDEFIRPFDGVEPFISSLAQRKIPIGVATSKRRESAISDLSYFDLYKYFDTLIGSDDVLEPKPKPEPLLKVMNILSEKHQKELHPHECIYIGDSPFDIRASHAAGMLSVAVEYGMFAADVLKEEKPAYTVATPQELNTLLNFL